MRRRCGWGAAGTLAVRCSQGQYRGVRGGRPTPRASRTPDPFSTYLAPSLGCWSLGAPRPAAASAEARASGRAPCFDHASP